VLEREAREALRDGGVLGLAVLPDALGLLRLPALGLGLPAMVLLEQRAGAECSRAPEPAAIGTPPWSTLTVNAMKELMRLERGNTFSGPKPAHRRRRPYHARSATCSTPAASSTEWK
jgi:hypothetical protein